MCGADFMVIPTLYHLVEQVPIGWRALKPHHLSISPNACAYSVRERYRTSIWSSETRSSIFTRILLKHTIYKSQKNAFLKWLKHIKKGLPRNGIASGKFLLKAFKTLIISLRFLLLQPLNYAALSSSSKTLTTLISEYISIKDSRFRQELPL